MNVLQRMEYWGEHHHPKWADILRFALGIFLCFKGIQFLENMSSMIGRMGGVLPSGYFSISIIGHYVVFAHLVGGTFLAIGLLTRVACLMQIPVLVGAIVFINSSAGLWKPFSEIFITVLVLLLLIYFLIAGSGPWSVDRYMEKEQGTIDNRQ